MNFSYQIVLVLGAILLLPSQVGGAVILNEVLPNPAGTEGTSNPEFVETLNSGSQTSDISGWIISDLANNTFARIPEGTIINPNQILVFYKSRVLNNTGQETVFLKDEAGNIQDQISYENAKEGLSWSKVDSAWQWSPPTPGSPNQSGTPTSSQSSQESTPILEQSETPFNQTTTPQGSPEYSQVSNKQPSLTQTSPPQPTLTFEQPLSPSPSKKLISQKESQTPIEPEAEAAALNLPETNLAQTGSGLSSFSFLFAIGVALFAALMAAFIYSKFFKR